MAELIDRSSPSGARKHLLGVLELTCQGCQRVTYLAADSAMPETGHPCPSLLCKIREDQMRRASMHTVRVYLQPGQEAEDFIKEHGLNPQPRYNIPPTPWQMITS